MERLSGGWVGRRRGGWKVLGDPEDASGAAGGFVDIDDGAVELDAAGGDFESLGHVREEPLDDGLGFSAEDAVVGAGEAGVA